MAENMKFCWSCGAPAEKGKANCPRCGAQYEGESKFGGQPALGAGGVGWSPYAGDPSFQKNNKKNLGAMLIGMGIVSAIIFVVMLVTGDIDLENGGIFIFGGVMAVLWTFWLLWLFLNNRTVKDWQGVVERKEQTLRERAWKDEDGYRQREQYMEYTVIFRRRDGKRKKLVSTGSSAWYDYLNEGDQVFYHGKNMNYYEKYDKTRDAYLPCASCGSARDPRENYCGRCGAILLKGAQPQAQQAPAVVVPGTQGDFCPHCGARLAPGGKFCSECGNRL